MWNDKSFQQKKNEVLPSRNVGPSQNGTGACDDACSVHKKKMQ